VISLLLLLLWGPRLQHRNLWGTDYKPQQQWVRICLPVNAQSTMKPWIIVLTVSAHGILVFLHVLGSLKDDLEEIDQCWVQPPTRFCGKRCTKVRKCVSPNYTCCWTYCGNICLNNEEPFETLMKV
ncbi:mCG127428, partial [Mus musculus]